MASFEHFIPKDIQGEMFFLHHRYVADGFLGAGAFGAVCSAHDEFTNSFVAIKKCNNVMGSRTLMTRTIREIRLLRLLRHPNIIMMLGVMPVVDITHPSEMYIIFERMEDDLGSIISSTPTVNMGRIEFYLWQMLMGLEYIHMANVVHRDLKPRNILVNYNGVLKIADFGLAKQYSRGNPTRVADMTEYATTRWYRAPEVIVGSKTYTKAVDMWAVGCILAELLRKLPLFRGKNAGHQLELQCNLLGKPPHSFIRRVKKMKFRNFLENLSELSTSEPFEMLFIDFHIVVVDVLAGLLQIDPTRRLSASTALEHEFLQHCREHSAKEPDGSRKLQLPPAIGVEEFAHEQRPEDEDDDFLRQEMLTEAARNPHRDAQVLDNVNTEPAYPNFPPQIQSTPDENVLQLALLSVTFSGWSFDHPSKPENEQLPQNLCPPTVSKQPLVAAATNIEKPMPSSPSSNEQQSRRISADEPSVVPTVLHQQQQPQQPPQLGGMKSQSLIAAGTLRNAVRFLISLRCFRPSSPPPDHLRNHLASLLTFLAVECNL